MSGAISLARIAGSAIELPASQGYIGTGGDQFRPAPQRVFETPGTPLGTVGPRSTWIGQQWAPGQGGDTPGGGGAGKTFGEVEAVQTLWITEGNVTPQALQHKPGSVGFVGSRRGGA